MAVERPVRSNTQTTVARWLRSEASSRSSSISCACARSCWERVIAMLSGSAPTLAVLKSASSFARSASWPSSCSTSVWKNSRVSPARPVRSLTFSARIRFTSSLTPL